MMSVENPSMSDDEYEFQALWHSLWFNHEAHPSVAVYRMYDHRGDLIYVGIASDWGRRMYQHSRQKPFFAFVREVHIDWFQTRDEALAHESQLIADHQPFFNTAGVPKA